MPGPIHVDAFAGQVWSFLVEAVDSNGDQKVLNRVHWSLTADDGINPVNVLAYTNLVTTLGSRWTDNIVPRLGITYSVLRYNVECITANVFHSPRWSPQYGGRYAINPSPTPIGGRAAPINPSFVTASMQLPTNNVSRYTRGGMRLSPLADADVNGDTIDVVQAGLIRVGVGSLLVDFTDAANNAKWVAVIWSAKVFASTPIGTHYEAAGLAGFNILKSTLRNPTLGSELHRKPRGTTGH